MEYSKKSFQPKANPVIWNKKPNLERVFVIPTKNIQQFRRSHYFQQLKSETIVIVESSLPEFRYSYSINLGIDVAIDLGADWIYISNDDIELFDNINSIQNSINSNSGYSAFTISNANTKSYHGEIFSVFNFNLFNDIILDGLVSIVDKKWPESFYYFTMMRMNRKFLKYTVHPDHFPSRVGNSSKRNLINFGDFGIFRADLLCKYKLDTDFINGDEDYFFTAFLHEKGYPILKLKNIAKTVGGLSLGRNYVRLFNSLLNKVIFSYKYNKLIENHF